LLKKFFLFLLLPMTLGASPLPLEGHGLNWERVHNHIPHPAGYRYYFGDVTWGLVVYLGKESFLGIESELQLSFTDTSRLASALLILGPAGIEKSDCLEKYKLVVGLLSKKYGEYKARETTKDAISADMVFDSLCNVVLHGEYSVKTIWLSGDFEITAKLIGDYEGFFIEIAYVKLSKIQNLKESKTKKALRSL